jgi:uncharacterized protein
VPIIDAHTHLATGSPVFNEWARKTGADHSPEGLLREMDANDIERAVIIGHWEIGEGTRSGPFTNRPNNDLVHYVAHSEGRFRGLLGVNLTDAGPLDVDVLDDYLARPEFPGVKCFTGYELYQADDPRLDPVLEVVEKHRAIVMFHTGDTLLPSGHVRYAHPMPADELAVAHPDMTIVLAHAGQHWMPDAGEVIGKNPNVWGDISGWFVGRPDLPPHVRFLYHQFQSLIYWAVGCDKLMFGTDWPLMAIHPYIEFVESCEFLTGDERRMIMYDNADRLYWRSRDA